MSYLSDFLLNIQGQTLVMFEFNSYSTLWLFTHPYCSKALLIHISHRQKGVRIKRSLNQWKCKERELYLVLETPKSLNIYLKKKSLATQEILQKLTESETIHFSDALHGFLQLHFVSKTVFTPCLRALAEACITEPFAVGQAKLVAN